MTSLEISSLWYFNPRIDTHKTPELDNWTYFEIMQCADGFWKWFQLYFDEILRISPGDFLSWQEAALNCQENNWSYFE